MLSYIAKHQPRKVILIIMAMASMMMYSMIDVTPVFADDVPPPPAEESVESPSADESVDPAPMEDTAVASPSIVEPVDVAPIEEPVGELNPTSEPVDIAPINDISLNPDDSLQSQSADTSTSAAQDQTMLGQIPEGTTAVVMVDGQVEPLVTQDAANAILVSDPMWCPDGVSPGAGCTANYPNVITLINNLGLMIGNGTIYFTSIYSDPDVTFIHTNINLSALGALTIQGGWNGFTGSNYALSGITTFSVPVTINWDDTTVTINDIAITGASGNGLTVISSGDIVLDNVQANGNSGDGAFLDNSTGNGSVTLTGTNTFNGNGSDGLRVLTKGAIDIVTITAGGNAATGNGSNGASLDNSAGSGDVNLSGAGNFNGNASSGLKVFSNGAISLANITASNNVGGYGAYLSAQGTGDSVTLNGTNIFNNNRLDGLYINANGNIVIFNATANSNGASGLFLQSTANVTVNYCTNAANNGSFGTYADLPGVFFLKMGDFSGNGAGEYIVAGGGVPNVKDCVKAPKEPKVNLTGEQTTPLVCAASGTTLTLPNGDYVSLPCPIGEASLTALTEDDLSDALPEGTTFTSGFNLQIATEAGSVAVGGEARTSANETMIVSFAIPEDQLNADLALFSWNGSKWIEIEDAMMENGHLNAQVGLNTQVDFDGLFILVGK